MWKGLNADSVCANLGLNAQSVCANLGLNTYFLSVRKYTYHDISVMLQKAVLKCNEQQVNSLILILILRGKSSVSVTLAACIYKSIYAL